MLVRARVRGQDVGLPGRILSSSQGGRYGSVGDWYRYLLDLWSARATNNLQGR
jgi:hypothetical protein